MNGADDIAELERAAQRLLDGRVAAIRELALAKQARERLKAELDEAERVYADGYRRAERAGWQEGELRELDFAEPERRPRGRGRPGATPRRKKGAPREADDRRGTGPEPRAEQMAEQRQGEQAGWPRDPSLVAGGDLAG